MKKSYRVINVLVSFLIVVLIVTICTTTPVSAASKKSKGAKKTKYVITKVTEVRTVNYWDGPSVEKYTYKFKYKNGLLSHVDGRKLSINKKGQYTGVKMDGVKEKIKRDRKGRVILYSGNTSDYPFYHKYSYNSKGLCKKEVWEGAVGGTNYYYYNKKGRISKYVNTGWDDLREKYSYDKKGNICKIKESDNGRTWKTTKIKNTYSGGKLTARTYNSNGEPVTIKYTYKKVKVPARFSGKVKRQQAWIRNDSVSPYVPDILTVN